MLPTATAELPGTGGEFRPGPEDVSCEEVLVRQAGGAGKYWWAKAVKSGIGTTQAREAIARSVGIPPDKVGFAGHRDRRTKCTQWFSVPGELVETPNGMKNAGFRSSLKVIEIVQAHGPIGPDSVIDLRWKLRLRGAAAGDGFQKAKAILARLRTAGLPNYVHPSRLGKDGNLVKWGRLLAGGGRLPRPVAATGVVPGECLSALQWSLFNRWLAARIADGLLATCLQGERVRTGIGDEVVVDDPAEYAKRFESWEAVALGPLFGAGMSRCAGQAAARESALIAEAGLGDEHITRLAGSRRPARVQPRKTVLDLHGPDLVLNCDLPAGAYIGVLADEIIKPAA